MRDDLTINGTGALTIESAYLDGINCRDSLRIVSGDITVSAVDDGLVGKDEVTIGGGTIIISAQTGDGIKATNAEDADRGFVTIADGSLTITTGEGSASVSQTGLRRLGRLAAADRGGYAQPEGRKGRNHADRLRRRPLHRQRGRRAARGGRGHFGRGDDPGHR